MTNKKKLIIGSRGSKLSLAYSNHVKDLLIKSSSEFSSDSVDIKIIKTSGDIHKEKKIYEIGGKGVFSKQIEDELLESKEVFLTSASSFVTPIIQIDNVKINNGIVGKTSIELRNLYFKNF